MGEYYFIRKMTPFEILSTVLIVITAIGIPVLNSMNTTRRTLIRNDIISALSAESGKLKDSMQKTVSELKALKAEMMYRSKTINDRIDGIEEYLRAKNGFISTSGNSSGHRYDHDDD